MILSLARARYVLYPAKCIFRGDVNLKGTYPIVAITRSYHQPTPFLMWIQCGINLDMKILSKMQLRFEKYEMWHWQNLGLNVSLYLTLDHACRMVRLAIIYGDCHSENVLHDKNFCKDPCPPPPPPSPIRSKQWFPSFHS